MDLLPTAHRAALAEDLAAAFAAVVERVGDALHFACWSAPDAEPRACHPPGFELSPELLELAAHATRPDVFPLRALSPALELGYPGAELLRVPVPEGGGLLLAARAGSFGDDPDAWRIVGETLGRVLSREEALRSTTDECERLRLRAEEIEALDVLGLAANRTLDPEEVLALVARFTRTLLEADYVTVSTTAQEHVPTGASIGLRTDGFATGDDPLARSIVEMGKPVYVGETEDLRVEQFPAHAAEGMQSGLGVPLSLFGETFGALVVGYRLPYYVSRQDTRLAVTLARHAAVAISNAQLHQAVELRSEELEQANLRLRELAGVKERFFNTMSHELRTPLNAMKGYTELLLGGVAGELPERAHGYVERCHTAALNLVLLVDDLLDFAKLEADRMEVNLEPCVLSEIVSQALATVEPQAQAKGLKLVSEPVTVGKVRTDAKRVRQILTNLLSNAVKFTQEGEIRLTTVEMEAPRLGDDDHGWLAIRVSDTGRGIPAESLELIFQEYGQVPGSDGTGLGLPISRKLARLLGGDLEVASEPGVGSTFTLSLPCRVRAPVPA